MIKGLAVAVFAFVLLGTRSCGSEIGDKEAGEPCTRTSECEEELQCVGGTCTANVVDAGIDDADVDDADAVDSGS